MARRPRLAVAGQCHLVLQRGHDGGAVFGDDDDRRAYLAALVDAARQHDLRLHGWGLGEREVRLLVTPHASAGALGLALQAVGRRYVAGYNRRHGRRGSLWEGRFRAGIVAPSLALDGLQFVEDVAMLGGAIDPPPGTPASSRGHHLGLQSVSWVSVHPAYWALGNTPFEREARYRERVQAGLAVAQGRALLDAALHGRVAGPAAFAARIAAEAGPALLARRPRGRPRRAGADGAGRPSR